MRVGKQNDHANPESRPRGPRRVPARHRFGQTAAAEAPGLKRRKPFYTQCRACHELKADQPHKVCPNLAGLLGSKDASAEDFAYSSALRAANLTWDLETLGCWLEKPSAVVPDNAMAFSGIANPKDRASRKIPTICTSPSRLFTSDFLL